MPDDHELRLIYASECPAQPWRNGGGETRELLVWPVLPDAWQLRISLARIDRNGPFSEFPGVERWFTVIAGAGVFLRFGSEKLQMGTATPPLRFDGAQPPDCNLVEGATNDLNLMCRRGVSRMQPAHPGMEWESGAEQSGIFTRTPGVWHDGSGRRMELPAETLLWSTARVSRAQFEASAASSGPAAYWLDYSQAAA